MNQRGQADFGVGGLIALLILIAIGALVLYEVTDAIGAENPTATITMTADNSASTSATLVSASPSSATLATTLASDNFGADTGTTEVIVQLNGENIIVVSNENITAAENTVTASIVVGTNTITLTNDNGLSQLTGTVVLSVDTYIGTTVENVEEKGDTVLNLLTILAIVVVAALIIGVVMRAIGGAVGGMGAPGTPAL